MTEEGYPPDPSFEQLLQREAAVRAGWYFPKTLGQRVAMEETIKTKLRDEGWRPDD